VESVSIVDLNLVEIRVGKMTKTQLLATAIKEMISMRDAVDSRGGMNSQFDSNLTLDMILGLCNEVVDHD